jgi:hypothetical protein
VREVEVDIRQRASELIEETREADAMQIRQRASELIEETREADAMQYGIYMTNPQ